MSTINLLTTASEIGCSRVVLVASLTEPIPGCDEPVPSSPYAAAKWASSAYGWMFFQLYKLPVVFVRPFVAYGPGQNKNKLIPFVIFSSLKNQSPQLFSGEWTADWIYVDDVIRGILLAASAPGIEGCSFDLGSGKLIKTRLLVELLSELVNPAIRPIFGAVADRPMEQVRTAKIDYTAAVLGWKPATSLREGLVRTIEWCKSQPLG